MSCRTSTPRSFGRIGHRVTGDRRDSSRALAGNSPMSPSMTTLALASRCAPTRKSRLWTLEATVAHYRSPGVIQTTVDRQWQRLSLQGLQGNVQGLGHQAHNTPGPIGPRPTARPSDSSRPAAKWAYGRVEQQRRAHRLAAVLPAYYNTRRPHSALGHQPPASRLSENLITSSRRHQCPPAIYLQTI